MQKTSLLLNCSFVQYPLIGFLLKCPLPSPEGNCTTVQLYSLYSASAAEASVVAQLSLVPTQGPKPTEQPALYSLGGSWARWGY
jgi:hypothetical protein